MEGNRAGRLISWIQAGHKENSQFPLVEGEEPTPPFFVIITSLQIACGLEDVGIKPFYSRASSNYNLSTVTQDIKNSRKYPFIWVVRSF